MIFALLLPAVVSDAQAATMRPRLGYGSLLKQVFSSECLSENWSACPLGIPKYIHTPPGPQTVLIDLSRHAAASPQSIGAILVSLNPAVEALKPGTKAASRVRNANILRPTKPMGTRPRTPPGPVELILQHADSQALAALMASFFLFLCSGVFWVRNKQPEEPPPYPLPEQATPMLLPTLRLPPMTLGSNAGVRSFP